MFHRNNSTAINCSSGSSSSCSDYGVVVVTSDDSSSTADSSHYYLRPKTIEYYSLPEPIDIDDIIKRLCIQPWEMDPPAMKFVSRKMIRAERPFNLRMFINAYKSGRSPPCRINKNIKNQSDDDPIGGIYNDKNIML
jgi:hypothetical protein